MKRSYPGEGKFKQRPWLLKCKLTPFTDGDDQADLHCHAGDTWAFVQEGHGALTGPKREPGRLSKEAFISFISSPLNHATPP